MTNQPKHTAVKEILDNAIDQAVKEELQNLLNKGHGGGNWRRLIIQRLDKLKDD